MLEVWTHYGSQIVDLCSALLLLASFAIVAQRRLLNLPVADRRRDKPLPHKRHDNKTDDDEQQRAPTKF